MDNPHQNQNDPQNRAAVTVLLFLLACTVRFLNLALLQKAPFFPFKIGDAARYDSWARSIAEGDWIGNSVGVFYQAPLYPYFLSTIYATLGDNIMTVRKVQALIGAISCVLLMNAAWNLFNRRAAIAAGLVMALYVPSIFLETMIQKSVLDLFFICLIIWFISKINLEAKTRAWVGLGIAVGALCLTRENALALVPAFLLWAVLCRWKQGSHLARGEWMKQRMGFVGMLLIGLCLTLGPVALRNYHIGGELQLTTSQLGPNFYIGNNAQANGSYKPLKFGRGDAKYEQADAIAIAETEMQCQLTANEVSDFYLRKSAAYIQNDPGAWLGLLGKKALMSVNVTEVVDTEDQYVYQDWSMLLKGLAPVFSFGLLFPLAVLGIWYTRSRWRELWMLYMMICLFQVTMIVFFVFGRYRFPIVPLLIVFASPVIASIFHVVQESWRERRFYLPAAVSKQQAVILAAVSGCLLIVAHLPIVSTQVARATTFNNFGVQLLLRGDSAGAEEYFHKCLTLVPNDALAHNNLGVAYRERQEYEKASAHFERAIQIAPQYTNARKNLEKLKLKQQSL